ncbi:MAG: hypothetical protein Q9M23_05680 [Mariprofundaceae bacterium]|nr:hypothetical protein [Mariprofundaceae bacterium]
MHETSEQPRCTYCVYIWYHANDSLLDDLQQWVEETGEQFGIAARLMVRKQSEKTTMMEIYELSFSDAARVDGMLASIEAKAVQQDWFSRIESPRRAEIFTLAESESIA